MSSESLSMKRKWHKRNNNSDCWYLMPSQLQRSCQGTTDTKSQAKSDHSSRYITVYVKKLVKKKQLGEAGRVPGPKTYNLTLKLRTVNNTRFLADCTFNFCIRSISLQRQREQGTLFIQTGPNPSLEAVFLQQVVSQWSDVKHSSRQCCPYRWRCHMITKKRVQTHRRIGAVVLSSLIGLWGLLAPPCATLSQSSWISVTWQIALKNVNEHSDHHHQLWC